VRTGTANARGDDGATQPTRAWSRRASGVLARAWGHVVEEWLGRRPTVVDTCMFFNEVDVLEVRFAELDSVVDRFVVVEAAFTHSGARKPLFFEEHRARFAPWREKIVHHVLREMPIGEVRGLEDRARLESFQREAIRDALAPLGLSSRDNVHVSDADEIPPASTIPTLSRRLAQAKYAVFVQRFLPHYVNLAWPDGAPPSWLGTVACRYRTITKSGPHHARRGGNRAGVLLEARDPRWEYVEDGGWHLTWMGGAEASWTKAQNVFEVLERASGLRDLGPPQPIQPFSADVTRAECRALQARYLAEAETPAFTPLDFDRFEIAGDLPEHLLRRKERFRRWFFFTSGLDERAPGG
jgi:hypothetical protein